MATGSLQESPTEDTGNYTKERKKSFVKDRTTGEFYEVLVKYKGDGVGTLVGQKVTQE